MTLNTKPAIDMKSLSAAVKVSMGMAMQSLTRYDSIEKAQKDSEALLKEALKPSQQKVQGYAIFTCRLKSDELYLLTCANVDGAFIPIRALRENDNACFVADVFWGQVAGKTIDMVVPIASFRDLTADEKKFVDDQLATEGIEISARPSVTH